MNIGIELLNKDRILHKSLCALINKWLTEAKDADAFTARTLIDCAEQLNNTLIASHKKG